LISNISKRYARAFFDIAKEENQIEPYYKELDQFTLLISRNESLKDFLANPVFEQAVKKGVVDNLIAKLKLSGMTANFIRLLVDKNRIDILEEYRRLLSPVNGRSAEEGAGE
jgi:F-type H+-transporting ATPase subunit delta